MSRVIVEVDKDGIVSRIAADGDVEVAVVYNDFEGATPVGTDDNGETVKSFLVQGHSREEIKQFNNSDENTWKDSGLD